MLLGATQTSDRASQSLNVSWIRGFFAVGQGPERPPSQPEAPRARGEPGPARPVRAQGSESSSAGTRFLPQTQPPRPLHPRVPEPHAPSTIPAVALVTSKDIASNTPPPYHPNVHQRLPQLGRCIIQRRAELVPVARSTCHHQIVENLLCVVVTTSLTVQELTACPAASSDSALLQLQTSLLFLNLLSCPSAS
ncbi:hypothetical protein CB1_000632042 [Camelus ferus]|nr:hypothetical protein CB1_000632042 [Camelus ferus]